MENSYVKICEDIIKNSTFLDKIVLESHCKSYSNSEKQVAVTISTKENEFEFILELVQEAKSNSKCYQNIYVSNENTHVSVRDISIIGYDKVKFGEATVAQLELVLEELANKHAKCIKENSSEKPIPHIEQFLGGNWSQSDTNLIIDTIGKEDDKGVDRNVLKEGIDNIARSIEGILSSNEGLIYVTSNILQKKLFFKNSEYHVVTIGPATHVPLVYDVLLTIFCLSNQKMRQHHFYKLVKYYYNTVKDKLNKDGLDLTTYLPFNQYKKQLHLFNSYVKIEVLKQICHSASSKKDGLKWKDALSPTISEVNECILYPNLSREDCYEILHGIAGSCDCILSNYTVIPVGERRGFLGNYYNVKLNVNIDDEERVFDLFAKYTPVIPGVSRDLALTSFKKEEFIYREFVSKLVDLGLGDICDFLPKCYFSRSQDVLVFEDVSVLGFTSIDVNTAFDPDLMKVVLKQLAKMHACSLLYEEIMTKKSGRPIRIDDEYQDYLEEMIFSRTNDKGILDTNDCSMRTFLDVLDLFPEIPVGFGVEEFKRRVRGVFDTIYGKVKKSDKYRNVICHGDAWTGNFLFRKNVPSETTDCYVVDYQLTRYCPPAGDILYLIYMVTDRETRVKYMGEFLDSYYFELARIFEKYNYDLNGIYTHQEFLDCCAYGKSDALTHAAFITQLVLFPSERMLAILGSEEGVARFFTKSRPEVLEEVTVDGTFRTRLRGIIEDLYEYCNN